jgi:hypothetical protein
MVALSIFSHFIMDKAHMDVKCASKENNSPWRDTALFSIREPSSSSRPSSQLSHGSTKKV